MTRRTCSGRADGVDAGHPQLAAVGAHQRGHRADERGLAGAVGPQDGHDLAALGHEVEPGQRLDLAEALGEAPGLDDRCAHRPSSKTEWIALFQILAEQSIPFKVFRSGTFRSRIVDRMAATTPAPLSGRRAQAARNDEVILAAARTVFVADPGAPVSAVAEEAGVGMSACTAATPARRT